MGTSNFGIQRACAWTGPAAVMLLILGCVLGNFIPPPPPAASGQVVADVYMDNIFQTRLGCWLLLFGLTFLATWGVSIAVQTRRMEGASPILAWLQLICIAVSTIIAVLIPTFWAVAAFRPDEVDPNITRMLNDAAWFIFLYMWAPFSLWCVTIGLAVLGDKHEERIFPRWSAYLNFWCALGLVPAGMINFFKTGPFAFDGILALYVPLTAFCSWMLGMTYVVLRAISKEEAFVTSSNATGALTLN